jgi:carbon monoxide dehydrogenase subunit G
VKITGSVTVPHPVEAVWDALLSPAVLVRSIPGCSRLETIGENSYAMTVTAGVAAIKGTYDGTAVLSDLDAGRSLSMRLTGAGAPGTIDATVQVALASVGDGTQVAYDADAVVGGMVGGVGQRMLTSVSKRMAADFFGRLAETIGGLDTASPGGSAGSTSGTGGRAASASERVETPAPTGAGGRAASASERVETPAPTGAVFTPPPRQTDDFRKGIAVGAGLVLLGVVAGRLCRR